MINVKHLKPYEIYVLNIDTFLFSDHDFRDPYGSRLIKFDHFMFLKLIEGKNHCHLKVLTKHGIGYLFIPTYLISEI